METRLFRTLVNVKGGVNPFILGKISGIQCALCAEPNRHGYAIACIEAGHLLTTKCTEEQYRNFAGVVETHYPGLCTFDYKSK